MNKAFEKILEKLTDAGGCDADCEYDKGWDSAIGEAISIVQEAAEEYNNSQINQLAMMYAENLVLYGVDITKRFDTAIQGTVALNQAYMRGKQDERDRFNELRKEYKGGWIPVSERLPEPDQYILVSFSNFSLPDIGRYEQDADGNGAFYPGDDDRSYSSINVFVNAWMPLPEAYKESDD